jgi:hypothetical protein
MRALMLIVCLMVGCGAEPRIGGDCATNTDCHSGLQEIPGAHCDGDKCTCDESTQRICCAPTDDAPDCARSCRDDCPSTTCAADTDCPNPISGCGTVACIQGYCVPLPRLEPPHQRAGDCQLAFCAPGTPVQFTSDDRDVFDDGDACTDDYCQAGERVHVPSSDGTPCAAGWCSGGHCGACWNDAQCQAPFVCQLPQGHCGIPQCRNGVLDSSETDLDCGGACAPCEPGRACLVDRDCASPQLCAHGVCQRPTATDGLRNGDETGIDCGGAHAPPCLPGDGCRTEQDCASMSCWRGRCLSATCYDGIRNGGEAGVDCGAPCLSSC